MHTHNTALQSDKMVDKCRIIFCWFQLQNQVFFLFWDDCDVGCCSMYLHIHQERSANPLILGAHVDDRSVMIHGGGCAFAHELNGQRCSACTGRKRPNLHPQENSLHQSVEDLALMSVWTNGCSRVPTYPGTVRNSVCECPLNAFKQKISTRQIWQTSQLPAESTNCIKQFKSFFI